MDRFLQVDIEPAVNGPRDGINTMGYYTRADLPFYHALADAFTICDSYFGSVIGSTLPNRLYTVSASIDPEGRHGGPVIETESPRVRAKKLGTYTWPTYPEQLAGEGHQLEVLRHSGDARGRQRAAVFSRLYEEAQARGQGVRSQLPDLVQGRLQGRKASAGLLGAGPVLGHRASAGARQLRRDRGRGDPGCARVQPLAVGEHRGVHDDGRGRRVLRSRTPVHGAARHARGVPDHRAPAGDRAAGFADRSGWAFEFRCS